VAKIKTLKLMENKINLVEILKDCPRGMELDCSMYDNLYFNELNADYHGTINCYTLIDGIKTSIDFTKYGTFNTHMGAKCVIFPKGKTTWEGFHRPFKDGDILATDLGSVFYLNTRLTDDERYGCYVGIGCNGSFHICEFFAYKECCGFATEEEKEKLFKAIKDNGYKWNPETKILEKLIVPKFKVGDVIQDIDTYKVKITEINIEDECYGYESVIAKGIGGIGFNEQDNWELVPNKFDINTLKPLQPVLVRNTNGQAWTVDLFSHKIDTNKRLQVSFVCVGHCPDQCIPYEGNEHLRGTTNDCDEFYKTWEK
jgi:hypothetical protein